MPKRSKLKSPWHYDSLFGLKTHLSDLTWERGYLVRTKDRDTLEIGDREVMIAQVLRNTQTELQPDKKLQTPNSNPSMFDIML